MGNASFFLTLLRWNPKLATTSIEHHIEILNMVPTAQTHLAIVGSQSLILNAKLENKLHLLFKDDSLTVELEEGSFVSISSLQILQLR